MARFYDDETEPRQNLAQLILPRPGFGLAQSLGFAIQKSTVFGKTILPKSAPGFVVVSGFIIAHKLYQKAAGFVEPVRLC